MRPASAASSHRSVVRHDHGWDQSSRGPPRARPGDLRADANVRGARPPSQRAMLSTALQRANTAVQLDNSQNFEGARQAYAEACHLLQQVLGKTTQDEGKRKLEAIVSWLFCYIRLPNLLTTYNPV